MMTLPFLVVEAFALVGVPIVLTVCLKLILQDARQERAKRDDEFKSLRAEIDRQLKRSVEDTQRVVGEMEDFARRVKPVRAFSEDILEVSGGKRAFIVSRYGGTRAMQHRSSSKVRELSKEWRQ